MIFWIYQQILKQMILVIFPFGSLFSSVSWWHYPLHPRSLPSQRLAFHPSSSWWFSSLLPFYLIPQISASFSQMSSWTLDSHPSPQVVVPISWLPSVGQLHLQLPSHLAPEHFFQWRTSSMVMVSFQIVLELPSPVGLALVLGLLALPSSSHIEGGLPWSGKGVGDQGWWVGSTTMENRCCAWRRTP